MRASLFLWALLLAFAGSPPGAAQAFSTFWNDIHAQITGRAAQGRGFSEGALQKVNAANKGQDAWPGNCDTPEFHGDRLAGQTSAQAFDALRQYIAQQKASILTVVPACNAGAGLEAMGRALHGIQDFYAHSSYADPTTTPTQREQAKAALNDPSQPAPAGLKMTSWGLSKSQDTEDYTHKENAKDSPSDSNYDQAAQAAEQHSREFMRSVLDSLSAADSLKLVSWEPPNPTPPMERKAPPTFQNRKFHVVRLDLGTEGAETLTVYETLPHGLEFVASAPPPTDVWTEVLESPDNPTITMLRWRLDLTVPFDSVHIAYTVLLTDEAVTHPAPGLRCTEPDPEHVLHHGDYVLQATGHADVPGRIEGDLATPIVDPTGVPGNRPGEGLPAPAVWTRPNPMSQTATVCFRVGDSRPVHLAVYDAAGREVRLLSEDRFLPGEHALEWDGRDAGGRPTAPGIYFVRIRTSNGMSSTPVVRRDER